jgi:NTE family protein
MNDIVLALGGGGAKGIAHVGVLRILEEEGFNIRAVAGTSAGGLVGALIACGYNSHDIEKLLSEFNSPHFFNRAATDGPSLMGLQGLSELLIEAIGSRTFDQLSIPFACTAVDLNKSQEVILAQGEVNQALMATVAVPGIFPPRSMGEYMLVDGGVMDPVPVALARWLAPSYPVVAVCLTPSPDKWAQIPSQIPIPDQSPFPKPLLEQFVKMRLGQALQIFINSIETTSRMLAELRMQQDHPDVIIRPDVADYGLLDQVKTIELIKIGENAAIRSLPEIRQAMSWSNQLSRYFRRPELPGKLIGEEDTVINET